MMPKLNTKQPSFDSTFTDRTSTMQSNECRQKQFRSRHALNLRNGEIVTKFCEMGQPSSIILECIGKHTARHNKAPVDDNFRGETRQFCIHTCDTVWREPGGKTNSSCNVQMEGVWDQMILRIRWKSRALLMQLELW